MLTRVLLSAYCLLIPGIETLRVLFATGIPPMDRILFIIFAIVWCAAALAAGMGTMRFLRIFIFAAIGYSLVVNLSYLLTRFDLLQIGTCLRTIVGCFLVSLLYRRAHSEVLA